MLASNELLLELLDFKITKSDNKYVALCLVCHKMVTNTAKERLKSHR